ncbi:hypothetical protein LVD15_22780 [Fulvivirga maritima]|uniref:hypothetical protein n=1 Tax=Fulvivirga maritima TaxID=2904247 RepID=UPI001F29464F|nr:hypothetical protein [Fulvivirga maritima]UII26099.1 hypothetical protein LVD15_22780 [Fulvivirga maritima]
MKTLKWSTVLLFLALLLPGCEVIGGIFKAGFWTGILLVFLIVAIVIWLFVKIRR